jgi:hypothetical protein
MTHKKEGGKHQLLLKECFLNAALIALFKQVADEKARLHVLEGSPAGRGKRIPASAA